MSPSRLSSRSLSARIAPWLSSCAATSSMSSGPCLWVVARLTTVAVGTEIALRPPHRSRQGIILMHDFQLATTTSHAGLLNELKAKGYKVVHMKAKTPAATLAQWDAAAKNEAAIGTVPAISVVRTVEDAVIALPAKAPQTK